jgi:hypothetical protein
MGGLEMATSEVKIGAAIDGNKVNTLEKDNGFTIFSSDAILDI